MGHYQQHLNPTLNNTTKIRSSTRTVPFSKPIPAQTLSPMTATHHVETNQVHAIHDLLVWYEIFELSPNGE
jgi:hypothetical protein